MDLELLDKIPYFNNKYTQHVLDKLRGFQYEDEDP